MFYAYMWLREDGTPYYVGKGSGRRAFVNEDHVVHKPRNNARILIFPRASAEETFQTEKEFIHNWGRKDIGTGCLRNRTDGGEGLSNHSPETIGKIRNSMMGNTNAIGHSWKQKATPEQLREWGRRGAAAKWEKYRNG